MKLMFKILEIENSLIYNNYKFIFNSESKAVNL